MKNLFKFTKLSLIVLLIGIFLIIGYVQFFLPNVGPPPELKVELTPERVANGKYLAHHVMVCVDCHSERDFNYYSGPPTNTSIGKGGEVFDSKLGFPGTFYSKNITPFNLKDWTDGEIFRLITTGVTKHGKAIFPVMPYKYYAEMDPEDVKDVIAYLRTLKPIPSEIPESKANFPFNLILNTIPQKANLKAKPDTTNILEYGKYLTKIAGCYECHTKQDDKGNKLPGMDYAGGWPMTLPNGTVVVTPNLTPDQATGLGRWTRETFITRFQAYADSSVIQTKITADAPQTIMPWVMYSQMKRKDLEAIYVFLNSLEPIKNPIEKHH